MCFFSAYAFNGCGEHKTFSKQSTGDETKKKCMKINKTIGIKQTKNNDYVKYEIKIKNKNPLQIVVRNNKITYCAACASANWCKSNRISANKFEYVLSCNTQQPMF